MITARCLIAVMPQLRQDQALAYLPHLIIAAQRYHINTPAREAAWLGQLAHESGALKYWEEIASGQAYEGRVDLGNTRPGDGRRFKGRGPIQITGRANYKKASEELEIDLIAHPEQAARMPTGFLIAAWYWADRRLNQLADEDTEAAYRRITRRINGGYNGWQDRLIYWRRARQALGLAAA
jgi:predicted chitinase